MQTRENRVAALEAATAVNQYQKVFEMYREYPDLVEHTVCMFANINQANRAKWLETTIASNHALLVFGLLRSYRSLVEYDWVGGSILHRVAASTFEI